MPCSPHHKYSKCSEKLGLFELLPYLNRVFKNKTATRRKRQVAGSKYRNHACCIAIS
ncbi:hypothetical protein BIFCAT_01731 [Bifidobacterium catenulatum DSM 16992 = JCM 1194 = LMG 11043]|uniref:Uncharacterized protein n=1 Tax=Bifidobacterium catenulatum DSM 16992 = JCM 1194 = LMG 11043 TaxID=566552 RepID=B6XWR7_9BIFI|nr:hypothetical protein BIFCAT_01731 [Bifidobacterium catenulatum DSM 16992 = JCM 1194 = LMG 11043]